MNIVILRNIEKKDIRLLSWESLVTVSKFKYAKYIY